MILAFSTSSGKASVAAIECSGEVVWCDSREAPMNASKACLEMLDRLLDEKGLGPKDADMFLADIGPGSFTGVRVGVTLAKTFAFLHRKLVGGASSFDLINASGTVVLPSKKGEYFIRRAGEQAIRSNSLPEELYQGFGPGLETQIWPHASRFASILSQIEWMNPEKFVPEYLIEPSISVPKSPFPSQVTK